MPEFVNTREQNDNVLITITSLCELSFTSGAGSGCLRQKGCASLLRKDPANASPHPDARGRHFAGVCYSKQVSFIIIIFASFNHMTPIKLKRSKGTDTKTCFYSREDRMFYQLLCLKKIYQIITNDQRAGVGYTLYLFPLWWGERIALRPNTERIVEETVEPIQNIQNK